MSQVSPSRESVAPLLLELARAVRARQFYPAAHPAMREALQRVASIWEQGQRDGREIDLSFRRASFVLPDGVELRGPGIDDLAGLLLMRRVRRLRILAGVDAREIAAVVEVLVIAPDSLAELGGFEQALQDAGVVRVTTSDAKAAEDDAGGIDAIEAAPESAEEPPSVAQVAPRSHPHVEDTVVLVRQLAELEICEQPHLYRDLADGIGSTVASLLRNGDRIDAYRAVLVYTRHAEQRDRPAEIRREATERLRAVTRDATLLEYLLTQACETSGLTSVQAVQALMCVGSSVVPHLLRRLYDADSTSHAQTTAVLIAMGEQALPAVVDELTATEPERARRAARLLGEMQNPGGVGLLLDGLRTRDDRIRRELTRALARIGTDAALRGLADALSSPDAALAVSAAAALGLARSSRAVSALIACLDDKSGAEEEVRREAIRSLGRVGNTAAIPALEQVLQHGSLLQRRRYRERQILAANAISRIGGDAARKALQAGSSQGNAELRRTCQAALARMERPGEA